MPNLPRLPSLFHSLLLCTSFALPASAIAAPAGIAVPAIAQDRVATTQVRVALDRAG